LNGSQRAAEDFGRNASGLAQVNLAFVLFLRSDIYAAMLQFAKERDKLPAQLITWTDPELLKRVIEQRIIKSVPEIKIAAEVWSRYFVPTVRGIPTWNYIGSRILPRPRDLIVLMKASIQIAVNRGRTLAQENDIVDGELQYSRFALDSLIVESSVRITNVEDMLLHFVQSSEIVTERDIARRMSAAQIPGDDLNVVIMLLTELTFLGFEVARDRFEFLADERDERKLVIMAQNTAAETSKGERRFRIHPAFHAFLEIAPEVATPSV
jgi:hypothetical protein